MTRRVTSRLPELPHREHKHFHRHSDLEWSSPVTRRRNGAKGGRSGGGGREGGRGGGSKRAFRVRREGKRVAKSCSMFFTCRLRGDVIAGPNKGEETGALTRCCYCCYCRRHCCRRVVVTKEGGRGGEEEKARKEQEVAEGGDGERGGSGGNDGRGSGGGGCERVAADDRS